jgi:hypothetical protein
MKHQGGWINIWFNATMGSNLTITGHQKIMSRTFLVPRVGIFIVIESLTRMTPVS